MVYCSRCIAFAGHYFAIVGHHRRLNFTFIFCVGGP
jgi:hypothetical protein